jgi:hypothetical protein
MQALDVSVHSMWRDAQLGGDCEFGSIVKNGSNNLAFPAGELKAAADLIPGMIGENRRTNRPPVTIRAGNLFNTPQASAPRT